MPSDERRHEVSRRVTLAEVPALRLAFAFRPHHCRTTSTAHKATTARIAARVTNRSQRRPNGNRRATVGIDKSLESLNVHRRYRHSTHRECIGALLLTLFRPGRPEDIDLEATCPSAFVRRVCVGHEGMDRHDTVLF